MASNESCQIMVFKPTYDEFKNFSSYIKYIESKGAHKAGVAKIIPPKEWHAVRRYNMKRIGEMEIKSPISQTVSGQQGLFQLINIQKKTMKVKEFKELAENKRYSPPEGDPEQLERKFWKNITFNPPIYGADVPGTIYDKDVKYWNINSLNTILDTLNTECNVEILGVNTAYLYFGMWKSLFPWHTEDMDLYSINYLHYGAPKSWYAVPPEHGKRLETLAKGFFSGSAADCPEFMRHKMTIISPHVLRKFSIPVNKVTQFEGEFMITFPFGYHSGFNLGFNIAESTNFASERWIEFGRRAKHCQCKRDSVKIDMDIFIRKFQPEEWKKLQDVRKKNLKGDSVRKRKAARANYSSDTKDTTTEEEEDDEDKESQDEQMSTTDTEQEEVEDKTEEEDETEDSEADTSVPNKIQNSEESEEISDTEEEEEDEGEEEKNEEPPNTRKRPTKQQLSAGSKKRPLPPIPKRTSARQRTLQRNKQKGLKLIIKKEDIITETKEIKVKIQDSRNNNNTKKCPKNGVLSLRDMWSFRPAWKHAEYSFNKDMSQTETKCSICVYFSQRDAEFLHTGVVDSPTTNRRHSLNELKSGKLLVTELCFAVNNSEEASIETAFNLMFGDAEEKEVHLLICASCHVAVHSVCYGVDMGTVTPTKWYCNKCLYLQHRSIADVDPCRKIDVVEKDQETEDIKCSLCVLRGGALKQTTSGAWCHVVCAIAIPEVYFEDPKRREGINIDALNPARMKLHCIYCSHLQKAPMHDSFGACVQCHCGKCASPFHVTCSFHNGVPLYLGDWPVFIETLCQKHCRKKNIPKEKREMTEVGCGDTVIAKHKNGRYYQGKVLTVTMLLFYKVVFDDKSFCFDLPPEDIQDVDARNNVLPVGEIVNILWTDAVTYRAEITGHWYEALCQVRFEDSSILNVKRSDLFLEGEELPKRVKSKMSYASETANKFYFPDSLRNSSKRPRVGSRKCPSTHKKL